LGPSVRALVPLRMLNANMAMNCGFAMFWGELWGEPELAVPYTLPGTFSGLHLCCLMYAAFKKFAPAQDVGIDFSREWMQVNGGR
ncbi:MAG: hypothetical protein ACK6EB_39540, partial [Planctomyces sp.]